MTFTTVRAGGAMLAKATHQREHGRVAGVLMVAVLVCGAAEPQAIEYVVAYDGDPPTAEAAARELSRQLRAESGGRVTARLWRGEA